MTDTPEVIPTDHKKKTWKREIGALGLLYAAGMGVAAASGSAAAMQVLEIVIIPMTALAGAAFGLDEYSKNIAARPLK